jgi:plasmid stability protein
MQYTIRRIPAGLDQELRRRAKRQGKSLNEVAIEALARSLGVEEETVHRELGDIAGSWKKDAAIESALEDQDRIDESLWE